MSAMKDRVVRHSPSRGAGSPNVWGIYEPDTGSIQYISAGPTTREAALIDVVWNFDPKHSRADLGSMEQVLGIVAEQGLTVELGLDTHPHADHWMASAQLKERTGAPNAIGEKVRDIAGLWREIYHMPDAFDPDRGLRPAVRRGRDSGSASRGAGDALARAHAGLDHLRGRERGLRARHSHAS